MSPVITTRAFDLLPPLGAFYSRVVHFIHNMTISLPSSAIELVEQQRVAQAKANGFAMFPIAAGNGHPAFVYTIGMAQANFPELLCFVEPGKEAATLELIDGLCTAVLKSIDRFGRDRTLCAFCNQKIATKDGTTYSPTFLRGDMYMYALQNWLTRAIRYRSELGMPQVIELRHDSVPNLEQIRAQLMLQAS